jgi:hypothetical protein
MRRELELTEKLKKTSVMFRTLSKGFHLMPSVVLVVAILINITLVLSVRFPDNAQNAWITNSKGLRVWNSEKHATPISNETDKYDRPYYGTDEGKYFSNGSYSGPQTIVQGMPGQDNQGPQREPEYRWSGHGVDSQAMVEGFGVMLLMLHIMALVFQLISSLPIVYERALEDAEAAKSRGVNIALGANRSDEGDGDGGSTEDGGGATDSATEGDGVVGTPGAGGGSELGLGVSSGGGSSGSGDSSNVDGDFEKTIQALVWEHFNHFITTIFVFVATLLLLVGRYNGRVPAPFAWATLLLVPKLLLCTHNLLVMWKPWCKWPLPELPTGEEDGNGVPKETTVVMWVEWLSDLDVKVILSKVAFWYSVTVDVLLHKDNLQLVMNATFAGLAVGGQPFFYCLLMLLAIKVNNPMQQVLRALDGTTRYLLASTMVLLVIVVYIFSAFAFYYLNGDLYAADSGSECDTLLGCLFTLFHEELLSGGSMSGKYAESWEEAAGGDPSGLLFLGWEDGGLGGQFLTVMAFEVMFYVTILVVMLNVVFGIIIDRFAELRDEKRDQNNAMTATCFVCGIEKQQFDNEGLKYNNELDAFSHHIEKEHNMWSYFKCQLYIHTKEKTELTGAESFLLKCLETDNTEWVPINKALRLHSHDDEDADSKLANTTKEKLEKLQGKVDTSFEKVAKENADMKQQLQALMQMVGELHSDTPTQASPRQLTRRVGVNTNAGLSAAGAGAAASTASPAHGSAPHREDQ